MPVEVHHDVTPPPKPEPEGRRRTTFPDGLIKVAPAPPGSLPRPGSLSGAPLDGVEKGYDTGPSNARGGPGSARQMRGRADRVGGAGSRTGTTGFGGGVGRGGKLDASSGSDAGRAPLTGHNVWSGSRSGSVAPRPDVR